MSTWLFAPPILFIVVFAALSLASKIASFLSFKNPNPGKGQKECYACGEDVPNFFRFAFFFTIIHVVALVISTVPAASPDTYAIMVMYIAGALIGLSILFRKAK
jgi:hypothetical protein